MNRILPNKVATTLNNSLPTAATNVANIGARELNNSLNAAGNAFRTAANGVANVANAAVNEVAEVVNNAPKVMNNALLGIPAAVGNATKNAANKMTGVFGNVANSVGTVANSVGNAANSVLNSIGLSNNKPNNVNANSNANRNANRNANVNPVTNAVNNAVINMTNLVSGPEPGFFGSVWFWMLVILIGAIGIFVFFFNEIMDLMPISVRDGMNRFRAAIGIPVEDSIVPPVTASLPITTVTPPALNAPLVPSSDASGNPLLSSITNAPSNLMNIIEKQLPPKKKEVFNVKENRYAYDDAEPLCKALGAELATYEQVKEAYDKGADWCNYGWVKGQRAIYPTQESTYEKLQAGPKEQRAACGKPGVNGGYFDNPELRFGVTCYGVKPTQKEHDTTLLPNGEANPFSPDALEFDKRVSEFKADSANIGILPFKENDWND